MNKSKEFIKGCILASTLAMLHGIYYYCTSTDESFVFISLYSSSALACSIVAWKD